MESLALIIFGRGFKSPRLHHFSIQQNPSREFEAGKYYQTRSGEKVYCWGRCKLDVDRYVISTFEKSYHVYMNGRVAFRKDNADDLICEWREASKQYEAYVWKHKLCNDYYEFSCEEDGIHNLPYRAQEWELHEIITYEQAKAS